MHGGRGISADYVIPILLGVFVAAFITWAAYWQLSLLTAGPVTGVVLVLK